MKPIFEMPELLTLDGNPFPVVFGDGDPSGCSSGCKDGCNSGCDSGATGSSPKPRY